VAVNRRRLQLNRRPPVGEQRLIARIVVASERKCQSVVGQRAPRDLRGNQLSRRRCSHEPKARKRRVHEYAVNSRSPDQRAVLHSLCVVAAIDVAVRDFVDVLRECRDERNKPTQGNLRIGRIVGERRHAHPRRFISKRLPLDSAIASSISILRFMNRTIESSDRATNCGMPPSTCRS